MLWLCDLSFLFPLLKIALFAFSLCHNRFSLIGLPWLHTHTQTTAKRRGRLCKARNICLDLICPFSFTSPLCYAVLNPSVLLWLMNCHFWFALFLWLLSGVFAAHYSNRISACLPVPFPSLPFIVFAFLLILLCILLLVCLSFFCCYFGDDRNVLFCPFCPFRRLMNLAQAQIWMRFLPFSCLAGNANLLFASRKMQLKNRGQHFNSPAFYQQIFSVSTNVHTNECSIHLFPAPVCTNGSFSFAHCNCRHFSTWW